VSSRRGVGRQALGLTAVLAVLGCSFSKNTVVVTGPSQSMGPGVSPSPAAPASPPACAVADMALAFIGRVGTCTGASDILLPVGCTATLTATPRLRGGGNAPPEVHGTNIRYAIPVGATAVQVFEAGNPFNLALRGATPAAVVRVEATLVPPGCAPITRAVEFQVR